MSKKDNKSFNLDKVNIKYFYDLYHNLRLKSYSLLINRILTIIRTDKELREKILNKLNGD